MNFKDQRGEIEPIKHVFGVDVNFLNLLVVALVASFASFLNFHAGAIEGKEHKWSSVRFFAHVSASIVAALLTTNIAYAAGVNSERIILAIAGVAGWAGVSGVNWVVYAVKMRALMFVGLHKAAERERFEDNEIAKSGNLNKQATAEDSAPTSSLRKKRVDIVKEEDETIPKD